MLDEHLKILVEDQLEYGESGVLGGGERRRREVGGGLF